MVIFFALESCLYKSEGEREVPIPPFWWKMNKEKILLLRRQHLQAHISREHEYSAVVTPSPGPKILPLRGPPAEGGGGHSRGYWCCQITGLGGPLRRRRKPPAALSLLGLDTATNPFFPPPFFALFVEEFFFVRFALFLRRFCANFLQYKGEIGRALFKRLWGIKHVFPTWFREETCAEIRHSFMFR